MDEKHRIFMAFTGRLRQNETMGSPRACVIYGDVNTEGDRR